MRSFAGKMLKKLVKIVLKKGLPEGVDLLNLNIPSNPVDEEFDVVELGTRMFTPIVKRRLDPRGKPYYWIDGALYEHNDEQTDSHSLRKKQKVTLTPLTLDMCGDLNKMKEWLK